MPSTARTCRKSRQGPTIPSGPPVDCDPEEKVHLSEVDEDGEGGPDLPPPMQVAGLNINVNIDGGVGSVLRDLDEFAGRLAAWGFGVEFDGGALYGQK